MSNLRLTYSRVGGKELSGEWELPTGEVRPFEGFTYEATMRATGELLQAYPEARLVIKRVEAPYEMTLPVAVEGLLRNDFDQAMEVLNPPPQRVVVAPIRRQVKVGLRHGHDTLADAFGEEVYVSRRDGLVESPFTGRWEPETGAHNLVASVAVPGPPEWMILSVELLLRVDAERYWLPRRWNPGEGWVTKEDLSAMLNTYKKEKANV